MHPIHIVYINGPDMGRLALTDDEIFGAVENVVRMSAADAGELAPRYDAGDRPAGHFDVSRAVVAPLGLAGVKVMGDFAQNKELGLRPNLGLLSLFDPFTGVPLAVLNAEPVTALRAGAMTALGAKYLARRNSRVLGHVGVGSIAYWNVRLLHRLFQFEEIRVHSKRAGSREAFAAKMTQELGTSVRAVATWEECVRDADIVVEASRLTTPEALLETDWIQRGALVIPHGTIGALQASLAGSMDKVVVDDRRQCATSAAYGALRAPLALGNITHDSVHPLGQIVAGLRAGRERDDETILYWPADSVAIDIALGGVIVDKAGAASLGSTLRFA